MLLQLPSRRLLLLLPLLLALIVLGYAFSRLVVFLHIFGVLRAHSGVRITQEEIALAHNKTSPDPRTPVVPKITHQIFHAWKHPGDNTLPKHWADARQSCLDLNPEWEHKIWYTDTSRQFLEENFSWFLPTYDSYQFPIQRIDVLRYFLIRHYGGIYLDLDNGCASSLDPLTYYPAFTTDGDRGALSNNIIGGQPGHPWFHLLTDTLVSWNWNYYLPYIIISYSSGQWFVTAMWERYHWLLQPNGALRGLENLGQGWKPLHHILMDTRPGTDAWVFFTQVNGGTWSNWDSHFFPWLGDHIPLVASYVVGALLLLILTCVIGCRLCARCRRGRTKAKGYQQLAVEEHQLDDR